MTSSYVLPIVTSVVMHAVLLAVVTWGWEASPESTKVQMPRYVEAKLVQLKAQAKPPVKKPQVNKVDLVAKRRAQEKKRREAEQQRRREEARKAARAKQEKERKEKEAELERQRQLEEKQQREEELKQQRLRQQQLAMEAEMASELEHEQSLLLEQEYATEAQSYVALIAARIEDNWNPPPSARKGMQCTLTLQLVPTGRVVNVTVSESSGNSAFDRSALQAVKKVERFPEVQQIPPPLFEREFRTVTLLFKPRDLRL